MKDENLSGVRCYGQVASANLANVAVVPEKKNETSSLETRSKSFDFVSGSRAIATTTSFSSASYAKDPGKVDFTYERILNASPSRRRGNEMTWSCVFKFTLHI